MRRKLVGILVCTLLITTALPAVGNLNTTFIKHPIQTQSTGVEWNYTYDGGEFDDIRHIEQTTDGGYISFGVTQSGDDYYAHLIKFYANGTVEWEVTNTNINGTDLGSQENDIFCMHIQQTPDGGYIANGWSMIYRQILGEWVWFATGFLWKTDATGTTEWLEHYYSEEDLAINGIYHPLILTDSYVSVGFIIYYDMYGTPLYTNGTLMKTNTTGAIIWQQSYDLGGGVTLSAISQTSDGGYILGGCVDNAGVNDGALVLLKTDSNGTEEWHQIYDGSGFEFSYVRDVFQTTDEGYIYSGVSGSGGHGSTDIWVIKTDPSGNLVWNKYIGDIHKDYIWDMCKTSDHKYVLAVCLDFQWYTGTKDDICLVQINEENMTEWTYRIEDPEGQISSCIRQTDDGGFIVSGRTKNYAHTASDGIVYKLSAAGTNNAPETPVVTGTTKPATGKEYNYTFSAIDPDGGEIIYTIDWGDKITNTTGICESGVEIVLSHTYQKRGKYIIKVTATDAFDAESPEGSLEVEVPFNQPETTDSIFGWTIIRGWVANMKKQGNDLYFRAVRLHYLEITGMEMSTGIIKLKRIRISDMGPDRQLTFGPLGSLTWIFGFCHGGLTEL